MGDWKALFDNRTVGASLYGASNFERQVLPTKPCPGSRRLARRPPSRAQATRPHFSPPTHPRGIVCELTGLVFPLQTLIAGKLAHYTLLYGLPLFLHGPTAMLGGAVGYLFTQVGWGGVAHLQECMDGFDRGYLQVCTALIAVTCKCVWVHMLTRGGLRAWCQGGACGLVRPWLRREAQGP